MHALNALLKRKYPHAKYSPRVGCQYCNGRGEVKGEQGTKPCLCIFVQHDLIEVALKVLPLAMYETLGIDVKALEGKKVCL